MPTASLLAGLPRRKEQMRTLICSAIKGGVGKTTVTAGLGRALARRGYKVAYLDCDFFAPNLNVELGANGELTGTGSGQIIPVVTPEGFELVSMGSVYVPDQAVTLSEEAAIPQITELLRPGEIRWNSPDFLLIDTAPTSGAVIQASLNAPDLLGTIIITHPSRMARADLLRSLSLMRDKRIPIFGVVVNQAYWECLCGHREATFDLTPEDIEEACRPWGVEVVGVIPHSRDLAGHFDALAERVLVATPVVVPEEPKPSRLGRRLMDLVSKALERRGI